MLDKPRQCQFVETGRIFYFGANLIDPSEPEFVPGKGIPLPAHDLICRYVTDEGEEFCPKHKLMRSVEEVGDAKP